MSVLAALTACMKDEVRGGGSMPEGVETIVSLGSSVSEMAPATRSAYISSSFDDAKITGLTVAVYDHQTGVLSQRRHFTSGFSDMEITLREGGVYDLYALANMGDQTASVPSSRSAMEEFVYEVPSYADVNVRGLPMTGSILNYRAGAGSGVFDLRRLFARVTLNVTAAFDGGTSGGVRVTRLAVCNGNGRLAGFGMSRMGSASEAISAEDYAGNGGPEAGGIVFYVPENRQGTIGSATSSRYKNPDNNAAVNARKDVLTYVDVTVTAASTYYSGTIHYRSYIGENATDNFDVRGNHAYVWNMRLTEDGLVDDDWKIEQDITDGRYLRFTRNPVLVEQGDDIRWADVLQTNLRWEDIAREFGGSIIYSATPTASGFGVRADARDGDVMTARFYPASNYLASLDDETEFHVISRTLEFDEDVYAVDPRATVDSKVIYSNSYLGRETGLGGLAVGDGVKWTVSGPVSLPQSHLARAYRFDYDEDVVSWTPSKHVKPGDYPISVQTVDGRHSDAAVLRVNDTRWVNTDGAFGGFPRETSIHKSALTGTYTWNIGYAYGDRSESDSGDMTSESPNSGIYAGESIVDEWQEHIGIRLLGDASGLVAESGPRGANTDRFSVSGETPIGDYTAEVFWKDTWNEEEQDYGIKDVAVLHVTGTNITRITIPGTLTVRKPSLTTVTATVAPSDATVRKVRWEVLTGSEYISFGASDDLRTNLRAVEVGEATIKAVAMDGSGVESNVCRVKVINPPYRLTVTPSFASVYNGETRAFTAICEYYDNTTRDVTNLCYWSVEDEDLATIGEDTGVARACASGTGTTTVYASFYDDSGNASGTATLEVKSRTQISYELEVTPAVATRTVGQTQQFTATFYRLTNGVRDAGTDVTRSASWTSGSSDVAGISSTGLATARKGGMSMITATYASGGQTYTGEAVMRVGDAVETYLEVTPETATRTVGQTQQFTAMLHTVTNGVDNGGVQVNASWSSSSSAIAAISAGGLATARGSGTATITATYVSGGQTYTGTATLKVVDDDAYELEVTPASVIRTVGQTQQFTATFYHVVNGVRVASSEVTSSATWSTSSSSVATVAGGLATAKGSGTATITATYVRGGQTYTGTATLKVADAEATEHELVLLGPAVNVKEGRTATASAAARYYTITYVNGVETSRTYVDVTAQLYSADPTIATSTGANGTVVTGQKAGQTYLYGMYAGLRNTEQSNIPVAVSGGDVVENRHRIVLTPEEATIYVGGSNNTQSYTVRMYTDVYTNGVRTTTDTVGEIISNSSVTWSIVNGSHASINQSGVATAVSIGDATVKAVLKSDTSVYDTALLHIDKDFNVNPGTGGSGSGGGNY